MTNNLLPTDYIYYVYKHIDPRTDELIYIGHGCRGRAWTHGSDKSVLRSQEHLAHLESMTADGFHAGDWVHIMYSVLPKSDACKVEQEYIRDYHPTYNKPQGKANLKLTPEQFTLCQEMRNEGMFYHSIAEEIGVSTMTVYRALNGKTKNIGEEYGA